MFFILEKKKFFFFQTMFFILEKKKFFFSNDVFYSWKKKINDVFYPNVFFFNVFYSWKKLFSNDVFYSWKKKIFFFFKRCFLFLKKKLFFKRCFYSRKKLCFFSNDVFYSWKKKNFFSRFFFIFFKKTLVKRDAVHLLDRFPRGFLSCRRPGLQLGFGDPIRRPFLLVSLFIEERNDWPCRTTGQRLPPRPWY